jgi:hypothetical protein
MDSLLARPVVNRRSPVSSPKSEASAAESSSPDAIALADLLKQEQAERTTSAALPPSAPAREIGGRRDGPEPTRYGDWEKNGRCIDF